MSVISYTDWPWEWDAADNIPIENGRPVRFDWVSTGGAHLLVPPALIINGLSGLTHYATNFYTATDWQNYNLQAEIRMRVTSITFDADSVDSGATFRVSNGEKAARIGFIKRTVLVPRDVGESTILEEQDQYCIAVWGGPGGGASLTDWLSYVEFDWADRVIIVAVQLNVRDGIKVYATRSDNVTENDLLLSVSYSSLPADVTESIIFGKFANSQCQIRVNKVHWLTEALGRVQPLWIVRDATTKAFEEQTTYSDITRRPFTAPFALAEVSTYLETVLLDAGWVVQLAGVTGAPITNGPFVIYKTATGNHYLYLWVQGGFLRALLYDAVYAPWANLFIDAPPYGTHLQLLVTVTEYQQSFLVVTADNLYWFLYGEDAAVESGGFLVVETGRSLNVGASVVPSCMIYSDDNAAPQGFHRALSTAWVNLSNNIMVDPGNIGDADVSAVITRLLHTQPILVSFLVWKLFLNTLKLRDGESSVIFDPEDLFIFRNKFQLYQMPWGTDNTTSPGDQESRFVPSNMLLCSEGLYGSLMRDEEGRIWIRTGVGPEGFLSPAFARWVIGPFGTDLEVND